MSLIIFDADGDVTMHDCDPACLGRARVKAAEVLAVPELLEQVMLALPMRDLLLSQRVASKWRDTVWESSRLQRVLFYKPTKIPGVKMILDADALSELDRRAISNGHLRSSLVCRGHRFAKNKVKTIASSTDAVGDCYHLQALSLNPLIFRTPLMLSQGYWWCGIAAELLGKIKCQALRQNLLSHLFSDIDAPDSCRTMLLTQPPTTRLECEMRCPPDVPDSLIKCGCLVGKPVLHPSVVVECCGRQFCRVCLRDCFVANTRQQPIQRTSCPGCRATISSTNLRFYVSTYVRLPTLQRADGIRLEDVMEWIRKWYSETQSVLWAGQRANVDKVTLKFLGDNDDATDGKRVGTVYLHPDQFEGLALKAGR